MMAVFLIFLFLALGIRTGFYYKNSPTVLLFFSKLSTASIYILLFFLGSGLGYNEKLFSSLPSLGLNSLLICLAGCTGSIIFLIPFQKYFPPSAEGSLTSCLPTKNDISNQNILPTSLSAQCLIEQKLFEKISFTKHEPHTSRALEQNANKQPPPIESASAPAAKDVKEAFYSSGIIITCFILGIIASRLHFLPTQVHEAPLVEYALWVLVFSVGVALGAQIEIFVIIKQMPFVLLAIPLSLTIGSIVAAAILSLFLHDISLLDCIIAVSGLGYYTLSSILIEQSGNASLATTTLLCNLFRELLGIVCTPLLVQTIGTLAPVGVAGAPAMDTCLPIVSNFSGKNVAIAAVISGMVLSLVVPLLISFLLYL